jgi:hypothetical protein
MWNLFLLFKFDINWRHRNCMPFLAQDNAKDFNKNVGMDSTKRYIS